MAIHFALLTLVYAAAVLQASVAPRMALAGGRPEFLLLVAVLAAFAVRDWSALAWAALAGLAADALSDRPLGTGMLVATLVMLFVQRWLRDRPRPSRAGTAAVCAMALALIVFAREAIAAPLTGESLAPAALFADSGSSALLSSIIGAAVLLLWRFSQGMLHRRASASDR
ncbi:MAG TPA: rod shape-determining protein MreD [Planctomycetaceae bacterium]|nr:rod shape-determining protein MreD [Planctomycetaceae bacterium]